MRDGDLSRLLASVPIPSELDARRRSWTVVRASFGAREPVELEPRGLLRPALAVAAGLLVLVAAVTPPGRAVLNEVRDAIGREQVRGVPQAKPVLFSLPAPGRLLVESARGPWIVQADGVKRRLGPYREASWSPNGVFVIASRENELVALEPNGAERWSIAKPNIKYPRWGGTREDTRVAYLSGDSLRVVAGDSEGDRLLVPRVADVAPEWKPTGEHVLAYALPAGKVGIADAETGEVLAGWLQAEPAQLAWSSDGNFVATRSAQSITIHSARGVLVRSVDPVPAAQPGRLGSKAASRLGDRVFVDMAFAPGGGTLAAVTYDPTAGPSGRSAVVLYELNGQAAVGVELFSGGGRMTGVEWSPDGRWLVIAWESADQWVFMRADESKVVARSSITAQLNRGAANAPFPTLAGWCCP